MRSFIVRRIFSLSDTRWKNVYGTRCTIFGLARIPTWRIETPEEPPRSRVISFVRPRVGGRPPARLPSASHGHCTRSYGVHGGRQRYVRVACNIRREDNHRRRVPAAVLRRAPCGLDVVAHGARPPRRFEQRARPPRRIDTRVTTRVKLFATEIIGLSNNIQSDLITKVHALPLRLSRLAVARFTYTRTHGRTNTFAQCTWYNT